MKQIYTLVITLLFCSASLSGEQRFQYRSVFVRGDVVTVISEKNVGLFTLELINSHNTILASTVFFPVKSFLFNGYAALIGLDSTFGAGQYYLQIKNGEGNNTDKLAIIIKRNTFNKEKITLNNINSSLRTSPDPKIISEAKQIHSIYKTLNVVEVSGLYPFKLPLVNGIITSWYGDRRSFQYSDGILSKSIHTGTDFAAALGTKIHAGYRGRVIFAGSRIITGNSVVLEYLPGVYGVFFHMDKIYVSKEDFVTSNTVIGTLGASGLATGPHLHWEIRVSGIPVNPYPLMEHGLIDKSLIMGIVRSHTSE